MPLNSLFYLNLSKKAVSSLSVELPVATQGENKEEALNNVKEAIEGYLDLLVCKGFRSEYSIDNFRRGATLLEKKLKQRKTKS